jgi:hypothetical protein
MLGPMIGITVTAEAFEAICRTMLLGSVAYESAPETCSQVKIWLEPNAINKLRALRGPGDSYSDVTLRIAANEAGA